VIEDKVEKHRELALGLIEKYIQFKPQSTLFQPEVINHLIRLLIQRVNSQPPNEVSEELRLRILVLMESLLTEFSEEFLNQVSEFSNMISKVLQDSYPEIKKQGCHLVITAS
jgi:hypothetical protein